MERLLSQMPRRPPVHTLVIHVCTVGITTLDVPEPFRRANITYQSVTGVPYIYRTDKEPGIGHTAGRIGQGACRRVYGGPTGGRPDRLHAEPPVGGAIEGHVHDPLRRGTRDSQFQTPGIVSEIIAALPIQTAGIDGKAADLTAARLDSTADVRVPGLDTPVREDLEIAVSRNKPLQFDLVGFNGDTGNKIAELITLDIDLQIRTLYKAIACNALGCFKMFQLQ